jgi:hypothetical protein
MAREWEEKSGRVLRMEKALREIEEELKRFGYEPEDICEMGDCLMCNIQKILNDVKGVK